MKVKVISSFDHGSRTLRRSEVIEVSAIQASALRGRGLVEYADGGAGAFVPRDSLPGADAAAPPANPPPAGGEAQPSSASLPAQAAPQTTAKRSRGGARAKAAPAQEGALDSGLMARNEARQPENLPPEAEQELSGE